MLNITFLDSHTLNPGDFSWEQFHALGNFTEYERTTPEEVVQRSRNADILIINKVKLGENEFKQLPRLRLICVVAAGYDVIDVRAARTHGIIVCNAAGYAGTAVAQMTLALLLEATNHVGVYAAANRKGFWSGSKDFCCWDNPLTEISGKRVAVVGLGCIGLSVAQILRVFGCKVCAVTSKNAEQLPEWIEKISIEDAFQTCLAVSFHCPLTKETKRMVNAQLLEKANEHLIIINTARGGIVDDAAVSAALHKGVIAAYCADVLSKEPPPADHPLLSAPNCFITPHIAWATLEARQRIINITVNNIKAFVSGTPTNVVN